MGPGGVEPRSSNLAANVTVVDAELADWWRASAALVAVTMQVPALVALRVPLLIEQPSEVVMT